MMRTLSCLAALGMIVAACGASDEGGTVGDRDSNEVVLVVTSEGGFMPVEFHLDRMPRYLVTADRTLYYAGPIPMIYPGPLLPNIQVGTVDEQTWSEIMFIVEDIGFSGFEERIDTDGAEMIADASTEFVTYYDAAGTHRYGIYALGLTAGPPSTDRLLLENMIQLLDQASSSGDSRLYVPERLQVAAGQSMMEAEPGFSSVEPWPLELSFDDMGEWVLGWRCTTVEGDEAADLYDVFGEANQATLWDTGTDQVSIKARPLLPGEEPCSDPLNT